MKKGRCEKGGGGVWLGRGGGGMSRGRDEQGEGGDEQGGGVSLTSIIMHNKSRLGGCRLRGVWVGG